MFMSEKKISALSSAAIPLSGGEVLLMNQSGSTFNCVLSAVKEYTNQGLVISADINDNIFIGTDAGYNTSVESSNFIGNNAGSESENAIFSNFIGFNAGYNAPDAEFCNFLGYEAGYQAMNADVSNFIGSQAGKNATNASGSIFIGNASGLNATNAGNSIFIGGESGRDSTDSSACIFIGVASGMNLKNGSGNTLIGNETGTTTPSISSLSGCVVVGANAKATASNQFVLGSTEYPLLTASGKSITPQFLLIRINGVDRYLPLYA